MALPIRLHLSVTGDSIEASVLDFFHRELARITFSAGDGRRDAEVLFTPPSFEQIPEPPGAGPSPYDAADYQPIDPPEGDPLPGPLPVGDEPAPDAADDPILDPIPAPDGE